MKKNLCFCFGLALLSLSGLSQQDQEELIYFPAQVSFVYPIGTHGIVSQKYVYNFSINILMGRTGAVEGFEGAGILNVNDKYFNGFQGAGIGNICGGSFYGFQGGGIFNAVGKDFTGFQGAGTGNICGGTFYGFQGSGIFNVTGKDFTGLQGAGIINITGGGSKAFQMAGIANINKGNLVGLQAAGIANAGKTVEGAQLAGITNTAYDIDGAQIAGIINIAENVKGLQMAGIVNICDSIDGIPIAPFSYVRKNGYRRFEISTSEINPVTVSFKTGVRKFYTIFSIGYFDRDPDYNITTAFGIGTRFFKNTKYAVDLELRVTQITKNFICEEYLAVHSLILDYSRTLFNRVEIFGGLSGNMLIASKSLSAAKVSPSWAMSLKSNNSIWGWPGFHAGLRF